ncbi:MAG: hypothetical protein K0S47_4161 [Herbinix sp.]|jgi:site-specific DNA recombinase|nr:hypothetical protein [Herbinix sp.]
MLNHSTLQNNFKGRVIVNIGIYLRKSRADDGVQDLAKHKEFLIKIANKNNWTYELYEEIESSQDLLRPELQRLRQDISLGKIDAVLVHALDRLSRNTRHFLEITEDYFAKQGMTRLYVKETEYDLTDHSTIMMLSFQATMSQAEYNFIVARLNDGRKGSIRKGIITGKLTYGYYFDRDNKEIKLHPEESVLVRKICGWLLQGEPYKAICDRLNSLGYRTRTGNLWDIYNIKSIAHSPVIRGHVIQDWKDKRTHEIEHIEVKNSHPAIITDAEYAKIKEIMEKRADNYKSLSTAPKHYLQGLLRCPNCHKVMTLAGSKPNRKKLSDGSLERSGDYVYYVRACRPQIKGKDRCPNLGCQAETIEQQIRLLIKSYQQELQTKMALLSEVNADDIKRGKKETVLELKKAIAKLENKEDYLLDLYSEEGIDKGTLNKKINKIKENKASLFSQLQEAEAQVSAVDIEQEIKHQTYLYNAIEEWDNLTNEQKRQILQMLFKEMWYERFDKDTPPRINVVFND